MLTFLKVKNFLSNILRKQDGQGMVEYALILALIAVVSIVIIGTLGGQIKARFQDISDKLGDGPTS